jgi:hypothetical protein
MVNRKFSFPTNLDDLRRMVNDYNIKDPVKPIKITPIILNEKDHLVLKDQITNTLTFLQDIKANINGKEQNIQNLLDTENNLSNIRNIYNSQTKRMNNELYNITKSDSVNKRLIEFYSKDYDLKSILKKYLKYIYLILIGFLTLLLIYKKQHKNKKILVFLVFLIIFPFIILKIIYDLIIKNIGHFKLDILYTFFIIIIIGIGFGGFKLVKKLLQIITTPSKTQLIPNITKKSSTIAENIAENKQ